jgi:hypothetical protein
MESSYPWGYRMDRPVTMGHRWKTVQVGQGLLEHPVTKLQPVCEAMLPVHPLFVSWTLGEAPIRNPCPVCADFTPQG